MARRHVLAAAGAVVMVGSISLSAGRAPLGGMTATGDIAGSGSAAAGGTHTVLATPDGRVFTWGGGDRGQIGDGELIDRWSPVEVAGLSEVTAVAAGAAHTVALTKGGEVYAWGANASGRLGDGTRRRRVRPVLIGGLVDVRLIAAGRAHTLAVTADGRMFSWGANESGQLGNGSTTESWVPTQVTGLSDVVAVAAGDAHSLAVLRDGRLFAWGQNDFFALGDGSTTNRLLPIQVGLTDVASVAAGAAHSLALQRSGAVFAWGRGANGQLGSGTTQSSSTPKLIAGLDAISIAAGRNFSGAISRDRHAVAWGANASGQLGDQTTVRRLRPVAVNGLDSVAVLALGDLHAIAITTGGQVLTWGAGANGRLGLGSEADQSAPARVDDDDLDWDGGGDDPPADTSAPTIVASTAPPLSAGWMTTPVTVSFMCSDDVGVASCSGPVTVTQDGFAQEIVGTAVDLAGNRATASVFVNMDLSSPLLSINQPPDGAVTDVEEVVVTGGAVDLGSGIADARCNGAAAQIVEGAIQCVVRLQPGRNEIILYAADAVGHTASASVSVTRAGQATQLALTPATVTTLVDEVVALALRDQFGMTVNLANWTTSNDSVVILSGTDPPVVTAIGVGEATVTAEWNGMSASAAIVVSAAVQPGAVRWTLPPLPGATPGQPLFANRVEAASPHLFTVDREVGGGMTIRAVTADGEVLWQQHAPGVPFMADSFGGLVAGVFDANEDYGAYVRFGGGTARAWRFESAGTLERPAQAADGTIYAVEHLSAGLDIDGKKVWNKYAIVIDGSNGRLISRTLFPPEVNEFIADLDGTVIGSNPPIYCRSTRYEYAPQTWGPFAGTDGRGYYIVRRHQLHKRGDCIEPFGRKPDRTIDMGLDLVTVSPAGEIKTANLFSTSCVGVLGSTLPCDIPVRARQVMPDGVGGTLVTWERGTQMVGSAVLVQRSLTRADRDGLVERPVGPAFWLELVGQAGTAITFDDGWKAMDVTTGDIKWGSALPNLAVLAARPDGGLATLDVTTGELKMTGVTGEVESTQPFGLDWNAVHELNDWVGLRGQTLAAVVGDFANATRWAALEGNSQGQLTARRPGMGISLKSQFAKPPFPIFHTAIKIAPINQKWMAAWYSDHPDFTPRRDMFQNLFITLGAGLSDGSDTAANCFVPGLGALVGDINRDGDIEKPAQKWTDLPVAEAAEPGAIERLLDWQSRYNDQAPYACFPEGLDGVFNSNSYVRSLLTYAQVPHDGSREPKRPTPGWNTILPESYFPQK